MVPLYALLSCVLYQNSSDVCSQNFVFEMDALTWGGFFLVDPNEEMMPLLMRLVGQKLECQHLGLCWLGCAGRVLWKSQRRGACGAAGLSSRGCR